MRDFDLSLLSGTVLCTIHLLLGMMIGYLIGLGRQGDVVAPATEARLSQFQAALEALARHVQQLTLLSHSQNPPLPPLFYEPINRLADALRSLQTHAPAAVPIAEARCSQPASRDEAIQAATRSPVTASATFGAAASGAPEMEETGRFAGLPSGVYEELTAGHAVDDASGEDPLAVRRPYHVVQYFAPWNGSLPRASEYQEVDCHDLSASGVSFFVKELPSTRLLTITLGNEHELLMLAEVVNHQRQQRGRTFVYLVGCRFTERILDVPEESLPVTFALLR